MKNFTDLMRVEYTAHMEELLDEIEDGKANYLSSIDEFYKKFAKDLAEAQEKMVNMKALEIPTDEVCNKCKKSMVIKWGRFGRFLACSGYPDCRNTREIQKHQDDDAAEPNAFNSETCEKCKKPMVLKRGKFGQFLACSGYPDCKNTRAILRGEDGSLEAKIDELLEEKCPKCKNQLIMKHGRYGEFTACSAYPDCKYIKQKEVGVHCPRDQCNGQIIERRSKRGKFFCGCSEYPTCNFMSWYKPAKEPCPDCGYPILFDKTTKRDGPHLACTQEGCGFKKILETLEPAPA